MKNAEMVTFGGSGLDRAADLRGDAKALAVAQQDPTTECLLLWRGKLLVHAPDFDRLYKLSPGNPVLAMAKEPPIFLGRGDQDQFIFAYDISGW